MFSVEDCLRISGITNVPVVFDTHHFECYKILHENEEFDPPSYYMERVLETWKKRGIKPKFHISEQVFCSKYKIIFKLNMQFVVNILLNKSKINK